MVVPLLSRASGGFLAVCVTPSPAGLTVTGVGMVLVGVVGFRYRHQAFRLWLGLNPLVREGGCVYDINRFLMCYVVPPCTAAAGAAMVILGLLATQC